MNEFKALLDSFSYEIILVTETWLSSKYPDSLFCNAYYNVYRKDRAGRGGGVAIYIAKSYSCHEIKVQKIPKIDAICLDVYEKNYKNCIRLINIYIPPNTEPQIVQDICFQLSALISVAHPKIIAGDFNFPNLKWNDNTNYHISNSESVFLEFCQNSELQRQINFPTRGENILDLVFTEAIDIHELKSHPPFYSSDHLQISFAVTYAPAVVPVERRLMFNDANYEAINSLFANLEWESILYNEPDINLTYSMFTEILHNVQSSYVPSREVKPNYLPEHIEKMIAYREKLWHNIRYPTVQDKFLTTTKKIKAEISKFYMTKENKFFQNKNPKKDLQIFLNSLNLKVLRFQPLK